MISYAEDPKIEKTIRKALSDNVMKGDWEEVINLYKQHKEIAHTAMITRFGDTATHIAVSSGLEEVVERLVSSASTTPGSLEIGNELGNIPLHLAASLGNVRMCKCIANHDSKLIGIRNNYGETPFFLAVHHGRKAAFLCLHSFCENGEGYMYCKKNYGETILHSAISGEYFDIAFQVIHLYPKLVNSVTKKGDSALHILASKPSVFRSGSHIRGFHKLIYHCIFVDELKEESSYHMLSQELQHGDNKKYPENYQTGGGLVLLLSNKIRTLIGHSTNQNRQQMDAEDPRVQKPIHAQVGSRKSRNNQRAAAERQQTDQQQGQGPSTSGAQGQKFFPEIYAACYEGLKLLSKAMLRILGLGLTQIEKLQEKKEKHIWSIQVMEKLLQHTSFYDYENTQSLTGRLPFTDDHNPSLPADNSLKADQGEKEGERETKEIGTPILIAAENGIIEMVERILELFPVAIHDMNSRKKNIVLLAAENRQPLIYNFLLRRQIMKDAIFGHRDDEGNSALHLAARLGSHMPWLIAGSALQMQLEIKWYEFVKTTMPPHSFSRYNKRAQTPGDIFIDTHRNLIEEDRKWLTRTSMAGTIVAMLITTVAFATCSTFPGGVKSDNGAPILEHQPAFSIFAISSLIALCFSFTALVMFLAILTSRHLHRHQKKYYGKDLPKKLLAGMTSLFVSIASMMVSFCAGNYFMIKGELNYAAFPVYAATCLLVTSLAIAQFPFYFDLIPATFNKVPRRRISSSISI